MKLHAGLAILAGIVGAVGMTVILAIVRALGLTEMNLAMVLGAMLTQEVNTGTWVLGFVIHLIAGGVFGLIYAVIFEGAQCANMGIGVMIALAHTCVSGTMLILLPAIHPAVPEHPQLAEPGFMAANFGAVTMIGFIVLHLVFGIIVGGMYRLHGPAVQTNPAAEH